MTVVEDCAGLLNETWQKILEPREVLLRLALVYGAPKLLRVQNVSGRTLQLQDFPNGFSVSFQLEWVDLRVSLKYLHILCSFNVWPEEPLLLYSVLDRADSIIPPS